jgi:hypothetical protein
MMNKKRQYLLMGCFLAVLAVAARVIPGPRTIDDAFITFRYARNILSGAGFAFNPGEHVMGTTTPFYTLLLALVALLFGGPSANFPVISLFINAIADAVTCIFLWKLGEKLDKPMVGYAAGVLWAIAPFSVTFSIGGMETSLYVFLLTASFLSHLEKRRTTTALLGILAVLTRPDAVLLIGMLALDRLIQWIKNDRERTISELIAFLAPAFVWVLFSSLYFGSPIPHSVQAKMEVYRLEPYSALIRLLQHYATPFMENNWGGQISIGVGLIAYPTLFFIGSMRAMRKNPGFWPFMVYPWIYLLVFSIPNPLIFRWYLTPPLPAYFLLILYGLFDLLCSLGKLLQKIPNISISKLSTILPVVILFAFPILSSLSDWRLTPAHGNKTPAPDMAYIQLELYYRQAAELLKPQIKPGERIAAGDVGVLGYYTNTQILDTVGLNSPESLKYYPEPADNYVINYAIPARLIGQEKPDWVVILEVYGRKTLLKDEAFKQNYSLIQKIPTDMYGSDGLLIFKKKS